MTPDPNIMNAPTVAALMRVLQQPPYSLPAPSFAADSQLHELWLLPITVTVNEADATYLATASGPWTIVADIAVAHPTVTIAAVSAPVAAAGTARRRPHRRTTTPTGPPGPSTPKPRRP
jgi:hypothetical protein